MMRLSSGYHPSLECLAPPDQDNDRKGGTAYFLLQLLGQLPDKSDLREKGFILGHRSRVQSVMVGTSREEEQEGCLHHICSQEAESAECLLLVPFLLI